MCVMFGVYVFSVYVWCGWYTCVCLVSGVCLIFGVWCLVLLVMVCLFVCLFGVCCFVFCIWCLMCLVCVFDVCVFDVYVWS